MKTKTAEKRALAIKVAKDVLKQIKDGFFSPSRGIYLTGLPLNDSDIGQELQPVIRRAKREGRKCNVCAIGSAFVSLVRLEDKFKIPGDYIPDHVMRRRLSEAFTRFELELMEQNFELNWNGSGGLASAKLEQIMRSIIKNKGAYVGV